MNESLLEELKKPNLIIRKCWDFNADFLLSGNLCFERLQKMVHEDIKRDLADFEVDYIDFIIQYPGQISVSTNPDGIKIFNLIIDVKIITE